MHNAVIDQKELDRNLNAPQTVNPNELKTVNFLLCNKMSPPLPDKSPNDNHATIIVEVDSNKWEVADKDKSCNESAILLKYFPHVTFGDFTCVFFSQLFFLFYRASWSRR